MYIFRKTEQSQYQHILITVSNIVKHQQKNDGAYKDPHPFNYLSHCMPLFMDASQPRFVVMYNMLQGHLKLLLVQLREKKKNTLEITNAH